jgi:hypothetical protein
MAIPSPCSGQAWPCEGWQKQEFLPSPSTGWEARATRHVLAVFHIGARRMAGGAEAGRSLPLYDQKSYERTHYLVENKEEGFGEPNRSLKTKGLTQITQYIADNT